MNQYLLPPPPKVWVTEEKSEADAVQLHWTMDISPEYSPVHTFEILASRVCDGPPYIPLVFKRVGVVGAFTLPMSCVVRRLERGHKVYLAVRAVDIYKRPGNYSETVVVDLS